MTWTTTYRPKEAGVTVSDDDINAELSALRELEKQRRDIKENARRMLKPLDREIRARKERVRRREAARMAAYEEEMRAATEDGTWGVEGDTP